jgi:predicted PurR-regulated permease PerM
MTSPRSSSDPPQRTGTAYSWSAATLVVVAVIAGFGIAYLLSDVLFLLFVGVVLATAMEPLIAALHRRRLPQPLAVGAAYAGVIFVLGVVISLGAPYVVDQVRGLASETPHASQQARQWLAGRGDALWARVAGRIVAELSSTNAPVEVEQALTTVGQSASYLAMAAHGFLLVCVVVLLAFYWSLQGDRTIRWLLRLLPADRRDGARDTIAEMEGKVGAYLRGQGLVCLAMAAMAAAVYGLLGLRYALVLGLVAGLMEVLPIVGPVLGAVPPLGIALFSDPGKMPWVLLAAILMQQAEGYFLVPRIMDKSVGVHPLVTLLAIAAFGSVLGLAGAILAIPLAAVIQVLLNRWLLGPGAAKPQVPGGRGPLSVLHYDAQQLLRDIRFRDTADMSAGKVADLGEAIEAIAHDLDEELQRIGDRSDLEDSL